MFQTRITKLLGIEYPIIQGGLQWLSRAELVAAVSNAGGLGLLTAATFDSKEAVRQEIRKTRSLTNKPFGVNITFVAAKPERINDDMDVLIEEGISIVETASRTPEMYLERLKKAGITIIHKVATVRHAVSAEKYGADAVAIVGFECGGHPSMDEVTSLVMIPAAVDALEIPVIAAGGIYDARGFVAALSLGAEGILLGTRFMLTQECSIHPKMEEWLRAAQETDTMLVARGTPRMRRAMRNEAAERAVDLETSGVPFEELLPIISGKRSLQAFTEGDVNIGIVPCGQIIGLMHDTPTVKEMIDDIINGAQGIINRLHLLIEKHGTWAL